MQCNGACCILTCRLVQVTVGLVTTIAILASTVLSTGIYTVYVTMQACSHATRSGAAEPYSICSQGRSHGACSASSDPFRRQTVFAMLSSSAVTVSECCNAESALHKRCSCGGVPTASAAHRLALNRTRKSIDPLLTFVRLTPAARSCEARRNAAERTVGPSASAHPSVASHRRR